MSYSVIFEKPLTENFDLNLQSSDSMKCFTSAFEISSVKPEDAGDILFIVMNSKGIDNAMVSVNVTVASFSVSKGMSTYN